MNGYLYAIQATDGLVKIGFTTKPRARLSHLRANNVNRLHPLGVIPATKNQEAETHALLKSERVRGEWFKRGKLVRYLIDQLRPWPKSDVVRIHRKRAAPAAENSSLLAEIDAFMAEFGIGEHRFGILACKNGRLVERLRAGRRIWPETEDHIREFMAGRRAEPQAMDAAE